MPIYEYYSLETHKIYSFFARRILKSDEIPRCPDGVEFRMEKMISRFAITGKARSKQDVNGAGPDSLDPRQEAAIMELAREMEGMDERQPEGRQMGQLMRRMTDLAGEKMPAPMEEMIRRMEAGEDPEKLEEEYGDALDDESNPKSSSDSEQTDPRVRISRRALAQPRRDPTLYEAADYL